MARSAEVSNFVKLDGGSSRERGEGRSAPFDPNLYPKELGETYDKVVSALRIVMIGFLGDCEGFFAEYDNYRQLAEMFHKLKIADETNPKSQNTFLEAPMNCWCELLLIALVALFAMPGNGGVTCERLLTPSRESGGTNHGVVFGFSTILAAYDWKMHQIQMSAA